MRLARRYWCVHRDATGLRSQHDSGNGPVPRKKCRYCGGSFATEFGRWHLFVHRGDGRYWHADSLAAYSRQQDAEDEAGRLNRTTHLASYNDGHGVVARWMEYQPCDRCGALAVHLTAWEHRRLCPACRDRYFAIIDRWHGTLPVTVGRGVQTPGFVTEMPRLTLGQLDEFDRTGEDPRS